MRVMLDDLEDDTETGVQARNGCLLLGDQDRVDRDSILTHRDPQRDNNRPREYKPRRKATEVSRRLGPYSRLHSIWEIDLRTKEAQLMLRVRDELIQHVGGNPNAVERLLIERATMLALKCAQIDHKIMSGEALTTHDQTHALAWNNGLRRCLVDLGLQARAPGTKETDLGDWIVRQNSKELVP